MTLKRYLLLAVIALSTIAMSAASKSSTVYIYGFAASFNDSTVYLTDIYELDSAYVDSKTGFLYSRSDYSYQLRNFLAQQGHENMTCITSFALTRKNIEKKYTALRKKYITGNHYNVNYIKAGEFSFTAIKPDQETLAKMQKTEKPKKPKGSKKERPEGTPGTPDTPPAGGKPDFNGGQPPMH